MCRFILLFTLSIIAYSVQAQSIVGTWQLVEEKSCFESALEEREQNETEQELLSQMRGTSATSVAKVIRFDKKGKGEEAIFKKGKRKGNNTEPFRYQIQGRELQFLDGNSGIITERFIIDELTDISLRFHDADKECEVKILSKLK
jgi:hypothetical protein